MKESKSILPLALTFIISSFIVGCGSSSSNSNNSDGGEATDGGGIDDLDLSVPQIIRSACGSVLAQENTVGTSAEFPTALAVGAINQATFENNATDSPHYYSSVLASGNYHVVVDSSANIGSFSDGGGIEVTIVDSSGEEQENVIRDVTTEYNRIRSYAFLGLEQDANVIFRVNPGFTIGDTSYQIGIFENGSAVPSPYLVDCPEILTISPGSTEAFEISQNNEFWLSGELDEGVYDLTLSTAAIDGVFPIAYNIAALSQFGQLSTASVLGQVENSDSSQLDAFLDVDFSGLVYLKVSTGNFSSSVNMELSLDRR